jgi:hypothetical protein
MPKAEGGQMNSLFIPPEMEMESAVPEDTYSNIPEDEMDDVMAAQKPEWCCRRRLRLICYV